MLWVNASNLFTKVRIHEYALVNPIEWSLSVHISILYNVVQSPHSASLVLTYLRNKMLAQWKTLGKAGIGYFLVIALVRTGRVLKLFETGYIVVPSSVF